MLLLAIDTSGKYGSIALARCGPEESCNILDVVPLEGGTFSAQLIPQIASLLDKHKFGKQEIDAFAVASGPGSFTGLRVGLAAIKGLAEILNKPIVAISLLEAVASAGSKQGEVIAALDAGRNEVYVGNYRVGSSIIGLGERLLSLNEFLIDASGRTVITPEKNIAEAARQAGISVEEIERPSSDAIARLGLKKLRSGETVTPEDLEANYIRRTDAEIFFKASP